ncbi:MAG: ATPase domain-containing protein [Thermoplasmata archaeon]
MARPPICPSCNSPNKMNAVRCRVCGKSLRKDPRQVETSPQKPVVLERVMTGEVFTAVLGEAKSRKRDYEANPQDREVRIRPKGDDSERPDPSEIDGQTEDLMARAKAAIEIKKFDTAIGYLDRILALTPEDPKAWYCRGTCFATIGNHPEAIRCYERAIEENSRDAQLWYLKGKSQKEIKSYDDALFSVDKAIEIRPDFADAWYSKGSLLQLLGKIVEAYVSFLQTLNLNPNHTEARIRINETERFLRNRGLQSLITGVSSWDDLPNGMQYDIQSGPSTSKMALLSLAEDAQSREHYDESLYYYDQALSADEEDSFLWQEKANLLSKMGRYRQAIECYQKSAVLGSRSRQVRPSTEKSGRSRQVTPQREMHPLLGQTQTMTWSRKSEMPRQLPDPERSIKEQSAGGETAQEGEILEEPADAGDISGLETRIDDIVSTIPTSTPNDEERAEDFVSSKAKVRLAEGREIKKTYVKGFDEALGGGIPSGHVMLVTGAPGTMKSSLAFSILYNHALNECRVGLYITLEQSTSSLIAQVASLGMDYEEVRESLRILDLAYLKSQTSMSREQWMNVVYSQIKKLKKKFNLGLVVIDSLDALMTLGHFEQRRSRTFRLFEWLRRLGVTTFVIAERADFVIGGNVIQSKTVEDFLADGIFHLRLHLVNDVDVQRRIRCLKMREMNHSTGYMALSWDDGSFSVTKVVRR